MTCQYWFINSNKQTMLIPDVNRVKREGGNIKELSVFPALLFYKAKTVLKIKSICFFKETDSQGESHAIFLPTLSLVDWTHLVITTENITNVLRMAIQRDGKG